MLSLEEIEVMKKRLDKGDDTTIAHAYALRQKLKGLRPLSLEEYAESFMMDKEEKKVMAHAMPYRLPGAELFTCKAINFPVDRIKFGANELQTKYFPNLLFRFIRETGARAVSTDEQHLLAIEDLAKVFDMAASYCDTLKDAVPALAKYNAVLAQAHRKVDSILSRFKVQYDADVLASSPSALLEAETNAQNKATRLMVAGKKKEAEALYAELDAENTEREERIQQYRDSIESAETLHRPVKKKAPKPQATDKDAELAKAIRKAQGKED